MWLAVMHLLKTISFSFLGICPLCLSMLDYSNAQVDLLFLSQLLCLVMIQSSNLGSL